MPIICYMGGPIFYGENCEQEAHDFEVAEGKAGNMVFYKRHRREIMAEFEASSRARDVDLATGKERLAGLGSRIDAVRAKHGLPDEIPPRSMMYQTYVCDLMQ